VHFLKNAGVVVVVQKFLRILFALIFTSLNYDNFCGQKKRLENLLSS